MESFKPSSVDISSDDLIDIFSLNPNVINLKRFIFKGTW